MSKESRLLDFKQRHRERVRQSVDELLSMGWLMEDDVSKSMRKELIDAVGWQALAQHLDRFAFYQRSPPEMDWVEAQAWLTDVTQEVRMSMSLWHYLWLNPEHLKLRGHASVVGTQEIRHERMPDGSMSVSVKLAMDSRHRRRADKPSVVGLAAWSLFVMGFVMDEAPSTASVYFPGGAFSKN